MNITEVLVQPQAIAWLPWAVQYFFYIGSAYAAAILFLIALLFESYTSHRLRAALVLTLAIGAIVGPLALTGDLHQPGRAWHFYPYLTPWSWMSLGSIFLPLFSALSVVTAWLYLRNDLLGLAQQPGKVLPLLSKLALGRWQTSPQLMLVVAALTVVSGLTIALYTGAEISIVQSRSLWHQPASPLLWFITAFLGAVGFTVLIWWLIPSNDKALTLADARLLKQATALSGLLAILLLPIWASNNASFSLYADPQWLKRLFLMALLLLTSVVLALFALREQNRGLWPTTLLALITLASSWTVRWVTMMDVQTIAKFDVGPLPYQLPLGSNGWLGIIGMFGLWFALALLGSELIQPSRKTAASAANQH
ncbi:putative tetrathionate reductase complex, subunit C [Vibrio vulnificus YJ016]|uniref:Putative tetrathionate reductase complex, subunit C n=1 Tax=Vibrio vulnificus (strain YJ016) TaxID=196600 RepID=Q7MJE1_VIBVY|nr:NrfD/PsrC family molybdoenzyme membrane anchor subunit [Vibrio vulnificus]ELV8592315.1 polysulfide reductase NrfD [Vibrio vulnificus]MCA3999705.1 polysulfide reductase NrfD [Vibrio vulnificus]MCA4008679.1 polysulfide reductase NrfD [Vibrio vulnificus]PWY30352.1 tetrathionate reductase [Vibrio vulnificus]BAC94985.1 putative tetrathionate reductase complex, subunit C [Vibrio vulnificus YJ016]